jgi:hypothetical protein
VQGPATLRIQTETDKIFLRGISKTERARLVQ